MRILVFLLAWCLAITALPAAAQSAGGAYIAGPQSGAWQSYRAELSQPTDFLSIVINIDYTQCFNGFSDETYTCLDSPSISGLCYAQSLCPGPYLRRVKFDATGVDFALYVPRTVFFCQDYPPAGRENISCAEFYENAYSLLYFEYSGAEPDVTITQTGSGAVPEPASWAMMITGFALIGTARRRRYFNRAA